MRSYKISFRTMQQGSVLIYVLWILVIISVLAFQLTAASRVITLNRSAVSSQLKSQMQIDSAVQFAIFKIISGKWKNKKYELNLNNQQISIEIYNESGFTSFYKVSVKSLKKIYKSLNIAESIIEEIKTIVNTEKQVKYNSFNELIAFDGLDEEVLDNLIPLISIFHEDSINPQYSPVDVLILLPGVDQFSVQKLRESTDDIEKEQLRNEIIDSLNNRGTPLSDDISGYYRVYISFADQLHRVFLKYNRRQKNYRIVLQNKGVNNSNVEF